MLLFPDIACLQKFW